MDLKLEHSSSMDFKLEHSMDDIVACGMDLLLAKTERWVRVFGINTASYLLDVNAGHIKFKGTNHISAKGSVQIVGTYWEGDGTFLWGWANPVYGKLAATHCSRMVHALFSHDLKQPKIHCSLDKCWDWVALTYMVDADTSGCYRSCPNKDGKWIFLTFGHLTMKRKTGGPPKRQKLH